MLKKKMRCKRSTVVLLGIIVFGYIFQFYMQFLLKDFSFCGLYHVKYQLILKGIVVCFCFCVASYYFFCRKKKEQYIYSALGLAIFPIAIYYLLSISNVCQIFITVYFVIAIFLFVCRVLSIGNKFVYRLNYIAIVLGTIVLIIGTLLATIALVKNIQLPVEVKGEEVITIDNIRFFKQKTLKERQNIAQRIVHKESILFGIEEPKVYVTELSDKDLAGFTNRTSVNIYISSDRDDVYDFVDTVLHEFFHIVEYELVFNKEKKNEIINKLACERIKNYQEEFSDKNLRTHNLQAAEIDADWYSRARILNYCDWR
ncbi:MAG: hypothetical protein ACLSG9_02650 [Eubacterium sp.]